MSAELFPTESDEQREAALDAASSAVRRGRLVVLPTDTVYGVGADAFDPEAVSRLLAAKGRGREMPPPVLVSSASTLDALATQVPAYVTVLVQRFWPGALTIVCHQQPSLQWDLGETRGTVAVRMPDHDLARALLDRTGPLAVSSANLTGMPAALDAGEAMDMLGESVAVVVDDGPAPGGVASTILDTTGPRPRLLRLGAVSVEEIDAALAELDTTVDTTGGTTGDATDEVAGTASADSEADPRDA
ncbi:L-threonylcarbamoyladenylate synthase [Nocardioides sp. SYSU DS0651]|uniref:L-threonylcarbamoyladenylate synthase n=1 Tax=Nocardioides sp. SYSU DS0651 TaxID=3415955 RepID=UPI003F4C5AEF